MREKLKEFDWHVHPPSEKDIDQVYKMVKSTLDARNRELDEYRIKVERENPEHVNDIMDDIGHYHGIENMVFWQFAMERIQGLFEGMIILKYLEYPDLGKGLIGLKAKIRKMEHSGYTLPEEDKKSLLEWGDLRNALSHSPPSWYGYVDLWEEDVLEYMTLVKRVISIWDKEKEEKDKAKPPARG